MNNAKLYTAGTLESSDLMVAIEKCEGIDIQLTSTVMHQFGEQIKNVILKTLKEENISDARVIANDRGALDCTIVARLRTAIERARNAEESWGNKDGICKR